MLNCFWFALLFLHSVLSQDADKYSDEDRPYKFGFNIEGYQHRQEEKDEKGIIKGEYGFITADGYYRVTVYATDENGDFRIISMKNYYVGFPPEDPTTTPGPPSDRAAKARQPNPSLGRGPTGRALQVDTTPRSPKAFTRPQGIAACSDCSIPTTTSRTSEENLLVDNGDFRTGKARNNDFGSNFGQGPARNSQFPQASPGGGIQTPGGLSQQYPQTGSAQGPIGGQSPQGGRAQGPIGGQTPQGGRGSRQRFPGGSGDAPGTSFGRGNQAGGVGGSTPTSGAFGSGGSGGFPGGSGGFPGGSGGFPGGSGNLGDPQNNQLGEGPNRRPQIGTVRDGLPPGVTLNDIKDLLYTFNYTVGFHGHHEDGFRNGDKQGDYFFDGRDGVERKVEYLANEFGYQPNITLIDLPENDVRRPNEQTEKEYGLKGYEFKWFYRK